uniref:Uncharacterized protein n=1 Tax=Lactuca sativa TaxID=4236 RepID=A0A9R1UM79_LACSA|nr:hypothetical protein LSAT_V11C800408380 [Lactuca sativa]
MVYSSTRLEEIHPSFGQNWKSLTCNLADGDITPASLWELPNLQELNPQGNRFIRLNFSLLQLPWLKYLNISSCYHLVELPDLPSSIAVVKADWCRSLESFGNISNCKWLWKVSLLGKNKLGLLGGDILLNSMLRDMFHLVH